MPSPDLLIGSITGTLIGVIVTRLWLWPPMRALPGFVLLLLANWAQDGIVDDLEGRE